MKLVHRILVSVMALIVIKAIFQAMMEIRQDSQLRDISEANGKKMILDMFDVPYEKQSETKLGNSDHSPKKGNQVKKPFPLKGAARLQKLDSNAKIGCIGKNCENYAAPGEKLSKDIKKSEKISSQVMVVCTGQNCKNSSVLIEKLSKRLKSSSHATSAHQHAQHKLKETQLPENPCVILGHQEDEIKTPFKVFVYDMPKSFTDDLVQCVSGSKAGRCMRLGHCGIGDRLANGEVLSVHDTHQFTLEVIMHHKMLVSPFRTLNPQKADFFYAPFYATLVHFCKTLEVKKLIDGFFNYLNQFESFQNGLPHLAAAGRIELEMLSSLVPLFVHRLSHKLIYLIIEADVDPQFIYRMIKKVEVIPVPYPSYGHYNPAHIKRNGNSISLDKYNFLQQKRDIFLFWAAGTRKSSHIRTKSIMPQFNTTTTLSYEKFMKEYNPGPKPRRKYVPSIWLHTPECMYFHRNITIQWMQHSVFCLQPPGDSPTRKSTFDAIISGCIPVIFENKGKKQVRYPFDSQLNYTDFTVTLPLKEQWKTNYVKYLANRFSVKDITRLQANLFKVAPLFQYSYPLHYGLQKDAMVPIMKEVQRFLKIKKE